MNSEIKAGEIAYVKVTGERVFVLDIQTPQANSRFLHLGEVADVRRPVMTENGVQHFREDFFLKELTTEDVILQKRREERESMQAFALALEEPVGREPLAN